MALAALTCCLLVVGRASAQGDSAQAKFEAGRAAFESQNYPAALVLFEEALNLGRDGPAVHFNIGVAAYKSGQYARAERAFRQVAFTPAMAPLAHYNLGLVALARGDQRAARRWFSLVRQSGDEKLAGLAERQLATLPAARTTLPWSIFVRGGVGYDDNVALRSDGVDPGASGKSDEFLEAQVSASVEVHPSWHVDLNAARLDYQSLDEFDQNALSLEGRRGLSFGDWYAEAGAHFSHLTLDGSALEQSIGASFNATRAWSGGRAVHARYRLSSVDGRGDYGGLSGTRHELLGRFEWGYGAWRFHVTPRGEINRTDDPLFETRSMELRALALWAYSPRWTFSADGAFRKIRHAAVPEVADQWQEDRVLLGLTAVLGLRERLQVVMRAEHEESSADVPDYGYSRNRASVSLEYWR